MLVRHEVYREIWRRGMLRPRAFARCGAREIARYARTEVGFSFELRHGSGCYESIPALTVVDW